ncbi:mannan endo-1,4-beta-mannosidase [Agromyces terreus]|uniref:Mannan endo-1,4-beta-mannosidase n=1 Tax=Agromyces terreus TaxID=424795 RepID=A0A9X2GZG4_9MICO|nr:glycosyl hydrolase [Agromyces terreus]MCP2370321.1 mannan endo-1,4-beta-mannosidase [Agromyces terreus]
MKLRHRPMTMALIGAVILGGLAAGTAAQSEPAEAFPASSKAAVLNYLASIAGTSIVSGQHNKEPATAPAQYTQQVKDITGQYPGLWGGDMMFRSDDIGNRQRVIDQAKTEWANGSLVALTWHACSPTVSNTCEFSGGVNTTISNAQFTDIVTGGTALNTTWRQRMAAVVPYLRQLKDAGVPVLWRPFHEMNETWNWWGGRPGANGGAKIYQQMRDYFDSQGLDNLIWVWNVQDNPAGGWANYYPGDSYVDVVSLDAWYKNYPSSGDYQQMQAIAGGKPIAIAEMGKVPDASFLSSQTRWSYFMVWSEQLRGNNSNTEIQNTYFNGRVLNQGEVGIGGGTPPPTARTGAIVGLAGKCVDAAASGTANGTAVQLYACASGVAQTWTVAADGTIRNPNSGRCLDAAGQGTANGTVIQLWNCNGSGAQTWVYDTAVQRLRNPQSGRCLDVTGQNSANGTRLQIWDCNTQANQRWTLPG